MNNEKRICAHCKREFIPLRNRAIYCSGTCKQYSYLSRKTGETIMPESQLPIQEVEQSTPALIIEEQYQENKPVTVLQEIPPVTVKPIPSVIVTAPVKRVKKYSDYLLEEKNSVNDQLYLWDEWNPDFVTRRNLVNALSKLKPFYDAILEFEGESLTLSEVKKFHRDIVRFENGPGMDGIPLFFPASINFVRLGKIVVDFIDAMEEKGLTELTCGLKPETKAFLEVNLLLIEEYKITCSPGWELP